MFLRVLTLTVLLLILVISPLPAEDVSKTQTEQVEIGQLDPASPDSIVFVTSETNSTARGYFGIRLFACPSGEGEPVQGGNQEGNEVALVDEGHFQLLGDPGELIWFTTFDKKIPVRFRWSQPRPGTVLGALEGPPNIRLVIELYPPFEDRASEIRDNVQTGYLASADQRSLQGELISSGPKPPLKKFFLLRSNRRASSAASYTDRHSLLRQLKLVSGERHSTGDPATSPYRHASLVFDLAADNRLTFAAAIGDQWEVVDKLTREMLEAPLTAQFRDGSISQLLGFSGSGAARASVELLGTFLTFNRFFNPTTGRLYLDANRHQDELARPLIPRVNADTMLLASLNAPFYPALSESTFREIMSGQLTDGRVPLSREIGRARATNGRSMMPVGSLAALKIYLATGDLELLAWAYPRLRLWNEWWQANRGDGQPWRDGDRDGLPEWGYNEEAELGSLGRLQLLPGTRRLLSLSESEITGPDESNAVFNPQTGTLEQNSVILSALLALDTECLSLIASEIGLTNEADELARRYQRLCQLINDRLWDEESGIYIDRRWNGQPSSRPGPGSLMPLAAGVPDARKIKRLLTAFPTLLASPQILDRYPLPVIYLLHQGLRRNSLHSEAAKLSRILENGTSNPTTRQWLKIGEVYSLDPGTGLSIGSPERALASSITGLQIGESRLDFILGPDTTIIRRNGKIELECGSAVRISSYRRQSSTLSFIIEASRPTRVSIPGEKGRKVTISIDKEIIGSTSPGVTASFPVPPGVHRVLAVR